MEQWGMTKCDLQIILSRYTEDISWTRSIEANFFIYDKSGKSKYFSLPNVGRETHTYLFHILNNYPFFRDYLVFLQADPFPHLLPGTKPEDLLKSILFFIKNNAKFKGLAYYSIKCDFWGRPHSLNSDQNFRKWSGLHNDIPVGKLYGKLFSGPIPLKYHTRAPAGLLLVHKSRILCRPFEFYKNAMNIVMNDPHDILNTGHAFERLWYIIFNGYDKINKQKYD
jgi:hypothetical protein